MTQNKAPLTRLQAALAIYDAPDPMRTWGLSVSPWSHLVDWQEANAAGCSFAIIKFFDGKDKVAYSEENYKGAKDAGILVGGYTWLYPAYAVSPGGAARAYLDFLKDHPCDIRPSIDFEWTKFNGAQANPKFDDLYGFSIPFAAGYNKLPMIYTAPGYWNDPAQITPRSTLGPKSALWADFPLWAAEYRTKANSYIPFGLWGGYKFLQFSATGNGALYGYPKDGEKEAELNYWPGSLSELYSWCSATPIDPPPPIGYDGGNITLTLWKDGKTTATNWRQP